MPGDDSKDQCVWQANGGEYMMTDQEGLQASDWTPKKQYAFRQFLTVYTAIAAVIQRRHSTWAGSRWTYIELTAGPGIINDKGSNLRCSPLIALDVFRAHLSFEVDCYFIEHDTSRFTTLSSIIKEEMASWDQKQKSRIHVKEECCDSKLVLSRALALVLRGKFGLLYWDGLGRDTYPSIELSGWLTAYPKHDLLVMASGTAPKRKGCPRLDRMLLTVPRKVWLSDTIGPWQWVFALATAWDVLAGKLSGFSSIKLHASTSEKGREILDQLGSTQAERDVRDQGGLWPRGESM
jgi:hypothetical protein